MGWAAGAWRGKPLAEWVGEEAADRVVKALRHEDAAWVWLDLPRSAGSLRLRFEAVRDSAGRGIGAGGTAHDAADEVRRATRRAEADELRELMLQLSGHLLRVEAGGLKRAIESALETLGRCGEASSCFLFEFDASLASASKLHEWRAPLIPSTRQAFAGVTEAKMRTLYPRARAGQTLRVNRLDELGPAGEAERQKMEALSIGAFLCVPVRVQDRPVGLVGFDHHGGGRQWTDQEERLLVMAAELFAHALDRRSAQDRLEFHVNNAPLAVIEWDARWTVQRWSPEAERIFGWSAQQVMGRGWGEWPFVHEEDLPAVEAVADQLVNGDQRSNINVNRNHTADGRVITCEWFNSVQRDHAGQLLSILSFARDITEARRTQERLASSQDQLRELHEALQKRADEALRESELRYRHLAEHATDLISCHTPEGQYLYASQASEALTGYAPWELVGRAAYDLFHPDDRPLIREGHQRMLDGDASHRVTYRLRRKDQSYVWVETISRLMDPGTTSASAGKQIVAVTRDVTARIEAEQQFRLVRLAIDQVREAVVITDSQLTRPGPHIVYVNPAFTALTGYTLADLTDQSPRILQGPRTDHAVIRKLRQALANGETFTGETVNYRKDRSEYYVEWNISPLTEPSGQITHWVAIQRDITQRRTAADMARLHREQLAHATRLSTMGELASGLAHELNQPLAAISNYLQGTLHRLGRGPLPREELTSVLQRAEGQSERAGLIIRRIRDFVTKNETSPQLYDVNQLIDDVLQLIDFEVKAQEVEVVLRLAEDPPRVEVDRIQLEQVLLNLIRNAIEAMEDNPAQTRRLELSTALNAAAGQVRLTVRDHGSGLSDEQLDKLFHPFFTTKTDGMGMGLTISQSIVQSHRGRLWARPHPERGTVFHLQLPIPKSER
jgi:two-component system sensor kinase FixL